VIYIRYKESMVISRSATRTLLRGGRKKLKIEKFCYVIFMA